MNISIKQLGCSIWILPLAAVLVLFSCKKNDEEGSKGMPVITKVRVLAKTDTLIGVVHQITLDSTSTYNETRLVAFDSTITKGELNKLYAIVGENLKTTKTVTFNGKEVYFNPTLTTDKSVIVNTGEFTPYGPGQTNKLVLITNYGTASYDFPIQQPAANITGFAPVAAGAGEVITITGTIFENLIGVKFGTTPAEIVGTPTKTEIRVKVPAGIVQSFIFVETLGGVTQSIASFGFKRLVYDDQYATSWRSSGYSSTTNEGTVNVKRGTKSLQCNYTSTYGAYRAGYNGATIDVKKEGITSIKVSIYGGPGSTGKKVNLSLNNTYTDGKRVTLILKEGEYTDFTVPLSQLGSPASINEIILQEFSGFAPSVIYIDDIGFI